MHTRRTPTIQDGEMPYAMKYTVLGPDRWQLKQITQWRQLQEVGCWIQTDEGVVNRQGVKTSLSKKNTGRAWIENVKVHHQLRETYRLVHSVTAAAGVEGSHNPQNTPTCVLGCLA
eukprot:GHUV01021309.1.p1 GENE.GHUV01021309.1~~GHUV01021309.1.p1  ORF type:complete len:116 (-),score=9.48 GHUV01021309.1:1590-1937(-)